MRRPFGGLRGRRPVFTVGIALNAALISLAMSSVGASPAAAANRVTQTVWIPLHCNLASTFSGGAPVHLAVALKVTHPATVRPGQKFRLRNVTAVQVLPPAAQQTAGVVFHADATEGVVNDFEAKLTNAKGNFSPGGTGTQVNQVASMQPPNRDAPPVGSATVSQTSPRDPLIDPNTAHPSPLAAWADQSPAPAASDARRHDEFSFGPIPSSGTATANSYGPAPGTGGGATVTSGTPDPFNNFPYTTTGPTGQNVVIDVGDASRVVTHSDEADPGPLVAIAGTFFHRTDNGKWAGAGGGNAFPVYCGTDNSTRRVPKPDPTMVDKIVIPITCDDNGEHEDDDSQSMSMGSYTCDQQGQHGGNNAQLSAVVKTLSSAGSDAGVAGTVGAILVVISTLLLVAVRRRRAGRL
jgi:hypothetical protein